MKDGNSGDRGFGNEPGDGGSPIPFATEAKRPWLRSCNIRLQETVFRGIDEYHPWDLFARSVHVRRQDVTADKRAAVGPIISRRIYYVDMIQRRGD